VKRITYWLLSTVSAVVLLFGFDASRHGGTPISSSTTPLTSQTTTGGSSAGSPSTGTGHDSTTNSRHRKNRATPTTSTVTGSVVNTQWGPVQVQLVVSGGTIKQVRILQYPNGNSRDVQIADYALPILIRETMQTQTAHIDMVSGATFTSTGYIESLQSALDEANL
jgi:uncharacterized protein with FMN-binding domain